MHLAHYRTGAYEREYLNWYQVTRPRPFDPAPFVRAARKQWADRPELVHALAFCTRQWPESELYTHLLDPSLARREGAHWRNAGGRSLFVPGFGELLVDLKSNSADPTRFVIGGIEYMDRVFDPAYDAPPVSYFRVVR
ncbi:MAG: hypothetical protein ABI599_02205 [Flavobacteriales bacterium]